MYLNNFANVAEGIKKHQDRKKKQQVELVLVHKGRGLKAAPCVIYQISGDILSFKKALS